MTTQSLLKLWTGPLPYNELYPSDPRNPLLHWIIHPLKRRCAKYYLTFLKRFFGLRVIAITGSAGKTTTKDLLHAILSVTSPTVSTRDNITPTYNIPTTILRCKRTTKFLILEMGIEYPGDMDFYTWLAQPDVAIITTINLTHTHFLKTLDEVIKEKTKLIGALSPQGKAIINGDDPNIKAWTLGNIYRFGFRAGSYCRIADYSITKNLTMSMNVLIDDKKTPIELPIPGIHLLHDCAAAAAAAAACGISHQIIAHGIKSFTPPPHRMQPFTLASGAIILDDSYNSNPLALRTSIDTLLTAASVTGKHPVVVLGQMNELGQYEQSAHEEIGTYLKQKGISDIFVTGPAMNHLLSKAESGKFYATVDELTSALHSFVKPNQIVLIKASRSFHFETIVDSLLSAK